MYKMTIKGSFKFPEFNFEKDLKEIARSIIGDMVDRIDQSIGVDDRPLRSGEAETVKSKFKNARNSKGKLTRKTTGINPFKPLVRTGRLRASFSTKNPGRTQITIFLRGNRPDTSLSNAELGKILQIDGVGRKRKTWNFFGISKRAEEAGIEYMRKKIIRLTSGK